MLYYDALISEPVNGLCPSYWQFPLKGTVSIQFQKRPTDGKRHFLVPFLFVLKRLLVLKKGTPQNCLLGFVGRCRFIKIKMMLFYPSLY